MTEFNEIVRLLDTDIKGSIKLSQALTKVHGISYMFSNAICSLINIDKNKKVGDLSKEEVHTIESVAKSPEKIPSWLYNRRKDIDTGKDAHLLKTDLKFQKEMDIKHLKKIKCYRGIRHSQGLPVRGQRTRSNFRKGKTVGVKKKGLKTGKK